MADEEGTPKPDKEEVIETAQDAVADGEEFSTLTKGEIAWLKNWIKQNKQNPEATINDVTIQKIESLSVAAMPVEPETPEMEPEKQPAPKKLTRREKRRRRVLRL